MEKLTKLFCSLCKDYVLSEEYNDEWQLCQMHVDITLQNYFDKIPEGKIKNKPSQMKKAAEEK